MKKHVRNIRLKMQKNEEACKKHSQAEIQESVKKDFDKSNDL